jgi:hypothetical protein
MNKYPKKCEFCGRDLTKPRSVYIQVEGKDHRAFPVNINEEDGSCDTDGEILCATCYDPVLPIGTIAEG